MPGNTDELTRDPCHTMAPLTLYQYFCLPFKKTLQQRSCENGDSSELRAVAGEVESKQIKTREKRRVGKMEEIADVSSTHCSCVFWRDCLLCIILLLPLRGIQ